LISCQQRPNQGKTMGFDTRMLRSEGVDE